MTPSQIVLVGAISVLLILAMGWFGGRRDRGGFSVVRVLGLACICLATAIPFAWGAYRLWDSQSALMDAFVGLALLAPLVTAYPLGYIRKWKTKGR